MHLSLSSFFSRRQHLLSLTLLISTLAPNAGCQHLGAKAWERGTLAKTEMQEESLKVDHSFDEHIYFSKEAASGGRGFGGGGCGCN